MKDFFDKHGIGVIVIVALLLVGGWYLTTRTNVPKRAGLGFDSTTYYKNLYQQGELNYQFHNRLKEHDTQLQQLKTNLDLEKHRIDGLHGPALQREVDRQFNQDADRQPSTRPATSGGQTNSTQRGRSAGGPPLQSRGISEPGNDCPEGLAVSGTKGHDFSAEAGYPVDEQSRPASPKRIGDVRDGFSSEDRKATPFTARKLVVAERNAGPYRLDTPDQVSRNNFRHLILTSGYVYPRVALAISSVETGGWRPTTEIIRQRNLFAMKANRRQNYVGLRSGYAVFATYQACLDDYGEYEQAVIRRYGLNSQQAYIDHICKRFCTAPSYRAKLTTALNGSTGK